jgi:hypothetical protein
MQFYLRKNFTLNLFITNFSKGFMKQVRCGPWRLWMTLVPLTCVCSRYGEAFWDIFFSWGKGGGGCLEIAAPKPFQDHSHSNLIHHDRMPPSNAMEMPRFGL